MNLLQDFKTKPFIEALQSFFTNLNVPFNVISELQTEPKNIIGDKKCNENISAIYPFAIVTDAIFRQKTTAISQADLKSDKYEGVLLFGVTLKKQKPNRGELAEITRQINREFSKTPVVVIFSYGDLLTFANAERIDYKQPWREGEKAGKISMLKDIDLNKTHAAHERILLDLKNKSASNFDELYQHWQKVLNTKELNKQFFKQIANWYFLSVAKSKFPYEYLKLDIKFQSKSNDELQKIANEKATIRFITRMIFVWFLREKKLISEDLFDASKISKILKKDTNEEPSTYYNAILQNLFFATLNKDVEHREFAIDNGFHKNKSTYDVNSLYRYEKMFQHENPESIMKLFEKIPFLNGGLFDSLDNKDQNSVIDGFSRNTNWQATMPDFLFFEENNLDFDSELNKIYITNKTKYKVKGLFAIFSEYKFTIEENTPTETDVALDPYLLGEIFENLLAYYNPETGTTARKGSGSFYTPQEIVNYMVDESLKAYLETKLSESFVKVLNFDKVETLTITQKTILVQALADVKILDPACGSGAFPMGVLYKMVDMLKNIDPDNSIWKQVNREKIIGAKTAELEADKIAIQGLNNFEVREKAIAEANDQLKLLEDNFDNTYNFDDYTRKLYIIQNCIYGVDIQDVAIQISKLRFFLSLIVDQKNDDIKPLPNLETKFVIANTLIGINLPKFSFLGTDDNSQDTTKALKEELKKVREQHFKATNRKEKQAIKTKDKIIRQQIANSLADSLNNHSKSDIELQNKALAKQYQQLAETELMPDMWQEIVVKDLFGGESLSKVNYRKERIKECNAQIKIIENKLASFKTNTQTEVIRAQALKIAEWDIYNQNASADWFDAEWMFGLSPEESNSEVRMLNKQINATNLQIDTLNDTLEQQIYKIADLQFAVANNQIDVVIEQIESIKKQLNSIFGVVKTNVANVVNEPPNIEYQINALNDRIEKVNVLLENLKTDLKPQPSQGVFDIVIGNPPYIKEYTDKTVFDGLRKSPYYQGKMDLWYFFTCCSIDILKKNGLLCFIAPNNWTTNSGASKMRNKIVEDAKIEKIIDFGSYMVFESAMINTMILILKRNQLNENYNLDFRKIINHKPSFADVLDLIKNNNSENNIISKPLYCKANKIDKTFSFNNNNLDELLDKIKNQQNFELDKKSEVAQGIVGAPDKCFIIENIENYNLDETFFLKKFYTGCERYIFRTTKKYIFYLSNKNFKEKEIDEFPNIKKHFLKFKKILEVAKIKYNSINKPYFYLHRERNESFFLAKPKIISPSRVQNLSFMYTENEYYASRAINIIISERINLKFLTSLLNSKISYFWFINKGKLLGNMLQIDKEPLLEFPIKTPTNQQPFITLVDQILSAKKQGQDTTALEHQIDVMVYHLYELSYDEACVIDKTLPLEDFEKYKL